MKKYLECIKEIRKDKRKSAIASLVLWLIFFIVIIPMVGRVPKDITIRTSGDDLNNNEVVKESIDSYKEMKSYNVNYLVETNVNNYTLNGTYYDEKYYYIYDSNNYYLDNEKLYYVDDINKQLKKVNIDNNVFSIIDMNLLTKDSLYTFITCSEEESKTSYKDGKVVRNYIYTTSDNRKMYITTTEIDNNINTIVIDYKDYLKNGYTIFKVTCNYQNINNLLEYNKDYTNYKILEEE